MPLQLLPTGPPSQANRREFLAGLALGGAALTMGAAPETAPKDGDWYALVSDTHIAADPAARHLGQVMADNLRAVTAEILAADTPPRGVFIDGDLALLDGQTGDYRTLLALLGPLLRARLPLHLALGNHDDRSRVRDVLRELVPAETRVVDKQVAVIDRPGMRFVVLDSLDKVNVTPGLLGRGQLDWLARDLDDHAEGPTLILVHHNPAGPKPGLIDTEALLEAVRPRRQVKGVVFGHTHVWDVREQDGLYLINLPAVAYPFAKTQPLGWCRFRTGPDGGDLELRCVGGDRRLDRQRIDLRWRRA